MGTNDLIEGEDVKRWQVKFDLDGNMRAMKPNNLTTFNVDQNTEMRKAKEAEESLERKKKNEKNAVIGSLKAKRKREEQQRMNNIKYAMGELGFKPKVAQYGK